MGPKDVDLLTFKCLQLLPLLRCHGRRGSGTAAFNLVCSGMVLAPVWWLQWSLEWRVARNVAGKANRRLTVTREEAGTAVPNFPSDVEDPFTVNSTLRLLPNHGKK